MMLPAQREMVKRLAGKPFTLLGINSDESRSALAKLIKDNNITWPNIYDGQPDADPIGRKWNVRGWPTIFVIDHEGLIRHRDIHDGAELEKAVDDLLAKVPLRPN